MKERTILLNGFSKAFAMTGWRVGYIAAPEELLLPMYKIHQYCIMCAPTASQYAAVFALKQGEKENYATIEEMRVSYDMRRRFLVQAFRGMGFSCFNPRGAFYVFPNVSHTGLDGGEFANRLLKSQQVAVVPGAAFGESGKNFVRCCYATGMKDLQTAVERIEKFLKTLDKRA
jgi:aminotransferase